MKIDKQVSTVVTEYRTYHFDNGILGHEEIVNGTLVSQDFTTTDSTKSHPFTYCNGKLSFQYIPQVSEILKTDGLFDDDVFTQLFSLPTAVIEDLENFNDWDSVVLIHIPMDGNIYAINSPYPLSFWKLCSYIGGFCDDDFYLDKVVAKLENIDWIRNISVENIPHYNVTRNRTQYVQFEYRPPQDVIKNILNSRNLSGARIKSLSSDDFGCSGAILGLDVFGLKDCHKPVNR